MGRLRVGGGGENKGNFDDEYWCEGTNHEPNNLKLQTNKKISNNKHEQPARGVGKLEITKAQNQLYWQATHTRFKNKETKTRLVAS